MGNEPEHLRLDTRALRVLAHPLRSRLLSALRVDGPATATELAARLDTNTGATSYHLRKLAEVGLVVEVGESHGRRRTWQAAQTAHSWYHADVAGDPDGEAAADWLRQHYLSEFTAHLDRWESARRDWPVAWQDAAVVSDSLLEVSADELDALTGELLDVIERHRQRARGGTDARRVTVYLNAMPTDPDARP